MKRFIVECSSFLLLLMAIFIVGIKALPRNPDNSFYANITKLDLVKTVPAPRIIFVGGSNLGYGLNSQEVKDSIGRNVINAGLQAGLGLKLKMDEIEPYLKSGDWIAISPEYTHFYGDHAYGGQSALPILAEVRPEIINDFNWQQTKTLISGLPQLFLQRINYFKSRFQGKKSEEYDEYASNYDPKTGDELRHLTMESGVKNIPTPEIKEDFNEDFFAYFLQRMTDWQSRGMTVIMLPPAYYDKGFNLNKAKIEYLSRRLSESGYPFAAPPEEFSYPRNLIYNTHYHVNKEGRELRTRSVIKALRKLDTKH